MIFGWTISLSEDILGLLYIKVHFLTKPIPTPMWTSCFTQKHYDKIFYLEMRINQCQQNADVKNPFSFWMFYMYMPAICVCSFRFWGNILCYLCFDITAHFKQARLFITPLLSQSTQIQSRLFLVSYLNMHLNTLYKVLTRLFNKRSVFLSAVSCMTYFVFGGPQILKMETVFQTMGFAVVYIFFSLVLQVPYFSLANCKSWMSAVRKCNVMDSLLCQNKICDVGRFSVV